MNLKFLRSILFVIFGCASSSAIEPKTPIERGPHHAVYQTVQNVDQAGGVITVTNEFVLFQPGLSYFDQTNSVWIPTTEHIELTETGAVYRQGPFSVRFAANHADPNGAIDLTLPDGSNMNLQTVGIAITDSETGESVWLGELKDSNGYLDGNKVVYPDAFTGIKADVQATITTGRFESDVIIRERSPIDPALLGMKLETCKLEIWHHIISAPNSSVSASPILRSSGSQDVDLQIDFGSMVIGGGNAFLLAKDSSQALQSGQQPSPTAGSSPSTLESSIPVAKDFFQDAETHKKYLIESVPLSEAMRFLNDLPVRNGASKSEGKSKDMWQEVLKSQRQVARAGTRRLPAKLPMLIEPVSKGVAGERKVASIQRSRLGHEPGFLLDYAAVVTGSDMVFKNGVTYYVTNSVSLSGKTILEGNTTIKFSPISGTSPSMTVLGSFDCRTAPFAPAVFTAETDGSIGDIISGSATSGQYAYSALIFPLSNTNALNLHDLRINYAQYGLNLQGTNVQSVESVQATSCVNGINAQNGIINVCNFLAVDCVNAFSASSSGLIRAEHATVHRAGKVFNGSSPSALSITNSLLVVITNTSTFAATGGTNLSSDSGVFQTVGAGAHYLPALSPYRNIGANCSQSTASVLMRTTTYAPVTLNTTATAPIVLQPQAFPDKDTPDLGFHYSPVDFITDSMIVTNTTLTLTNGVSIASYNGTGILLYNNASLISHGSPGTPNRLSRYTTFQEQPVGIGAGTPISVTAYEWSAGQIPSVRLRFTEMSGQGYHLYQSSSYAYNALSVRDSAFKAGRVSLGSNTDGLATYSFTNNLFDGCVTSFTSTNTGICANNLFRNGTLVVSSSGVSSILTLKDNAFDNVTIGTASSTINSNNAYMNYPGAFNRFTPTNAADLIISSFLFTNGPSGNYYQHSNDLVDKGSRSSPDAGLYHYTARQNQTKETTTAVDIGLHYVAGDNVWVEDAVPPGSLLSTFNDFWSWVGSPVFSGSLSHQSTNYANFHQHLFHEVPVANRLNVNQGDWLFTYVFLDSGAQPAEIMLEFEKPGGDWEHRVYWGANSISGGVIPYYYGGPLPAVGQWVRLSFPARAIGLEGSTLAGMSFTHSNGRATWDRSGVSSVSGSDKDSDGIPDYLEDLDGDGTLDGNESDWETLDSDGDGLNDGAELGLGLDPLVDQAANSGTRRNILYDRKNQLDSITGATTINVGLDAEGNIQTIAP